MISVSTLYSACPKKGCVKALKNNKVKHLERALVEWHLKYWPPFFRVRAYFSAPWSLFYQLLWVVKWQRGFLFFYFCLESPLLVRWLDKQNPYCDGQGGGEIALYGAPFQLGVIQLGCLRSTVALQFRVRWFGRGRAYSLIYTADILEWIWTRTHDMD